MWFKDLPYASDGWLRTAGRPMLDVMTPKTSFVRFYLRLSFQLIIFGFIFLAIGIFFLRSFASLPNSNEKIKQLALQHMVGLKMALRQENGAQRMQRIFPEGACFTLTLYGLA
jgi:hypothetical protein